MAFTIAAMVIFCAALTPLAIADSSVSSLEAEHRAASMMDLEMTRMREQRAASMAALESNMTLHEAYAILRRSPQASEKLLPLVSRQQHLGKSSKHAFLGTDAKANPKGYSGVDKARGMLNSMLSEVENKYDIEELRCQNFFNAQCSLMEQCREDIAAQNSAAANARERILASQGNINHAEVELPRLNHERATNERTCYHEITDLKDALQIVLDDIAVMTNVLEMTDCDANKASFIQDMRVVHCQCGNNTVVEFHHPDLNQSVAKFKSQTIRDAVLASLQSLLHQDQAPDLSNVSNFTNPPVPQTEIPPNPCVGIKFDDAASEGKGGSCSLSTNPQCYKIQGKFLDIQSGIEDKRDILQEELAKTEKDCKDVKETLDDQISLTQTSFQNSQKDLAGATAEENSAGETARMKMEEHGNLAKDMFATRETCSTNLRTFESEMCALRKIRGELQKIQGDQHSAFFQDCEVSEWTEGECSVTCGGGFQVLTRAVTVQPFKGVECPPLSGNQTCGMDPCPVDCVVGDWSGWSACSADCDGGVQQRTRPILTQPMNGGEACGETSQSQSCNTEACDQDCLLADWTAWSDCSKACGVGTTFRDKAVAKPEVGGGHCPLEDSHERHEEKTCNDFPCPKLSLEEPLSCDAAVDVILVLDGSLSVGQEGWDATTSFAGKFVHSFEGKNANAQFSIIAFGGPKTWSAYIACHTNPNVDWKTTCGIDMVQHMETDVAATKAKVEGLEWPKGYSTFTSMALFNAYTELQMTRSDVPTVVLLITDGRALSVRNTGLVADSIKSKGARMMVVPVQGRGLSNEDKDNMVAWASEPKADNFMPLGSFSDLDVVSTIDMIVASACPESPFQLG